MPTAGRLAAAILFAGLAWITSRLIVPLFPEGTDIGWFAEVNAGIGFVMGWSVAGRRAGGGWTAAVSYGLTAAAATVLWCLFLHNFADMIRKSLRKLYDGPVEALIDVFRLMWDGAALMAVPSVILTLVIGGIIAGLLTEAAARTWR